MKTYTRLRMKIAAGIKGLNLKMAGGKVAPLPNKGHELHLTRAQHEMTPEQLRAMFAEEKAGKTRKPRDARGRGQSRSTRRG